MVLNLACGRDGVGTNSTFKAQVKIPDTVRDVLLFFLFSRANSSEPLYSSI